MFMQAKTLIPILFHKYVACYHSAHLFLTRKTFKSSK